MKSGIYDGWNTHTLDTVRCEKTAEVIISISAESREKVDEMVNKAFAAGAKPSNGKMEEGFMYGWSFQDLDDHLWEIFYMDMTKIS